MKNFDCASMLLQLIDQRREKAKNFVEFAKTKNLDELGEEMAANYFKEVALLEKLDFLGMYVSISGEYYDQECKHLNRFPIEQKI